MNIDLLCGHNTILHCGCMECAKEDLQSKLSAAREALTQIVKLGEGPLKNCMTQESYLAAEALKVIGEE